MKGSESFSIEHPRLEKILDYKGYRCWLLNFNLEVKPLKMSLGVRIRSYIKIVNVIPEDDVLQIATLKIGIEGDVRVESLSFPLQFNHPLLVFADKLL